MSQSQCVWSFHEIQDSGQCRWQTNYHNAHGPRLSEIKLHSRFFNHTISHAVWAIALYSASALERDTSCFLLLQVTRFPPTKVKYPVIDFLSSRLLAYPESENLEMRTCPCFLYTNPFSGQLLMYARTLIAANQWVSLGWCMNLLSTPTTNISGLVTMRYINFSINLLYRPRSSSVWLSSNYIFTFASIGVLAGLHPKVLLLQEDSEHTFTRKEVHFVFDVQLQSP